MIGALLAALLGRCPNCQKGKIYTSFLKVADTCDVCHVRFERWSGSWTIPAVMGYGAGALFAIALGGYFLQIGQLKGSEKIIIPATLIFTACFYPLCKNLSMFMLWNNGFMTVDPPQLVPTDTPEE
jgi:uncharacterized protein (DUF983 family)